MENGINRQSPITVLPGVGKVRAAAYKKLGIATLGDLLLYYPRAYENRGEVSLLTEALPDRKCSVILTVATAPRAVRLRSHKSFLKFRAYDDSASCEVVFFNQDYLKTQFPIGATFRFYGKVEKTGNRYSMSSPAFEAWFEGAELPPLYPIYRMTEGLSQKQIAKDVFAALSLLSASDEDDPLPEYIQKSRSLCTLSYAQKQIHRPDSIGNLQIARRRLVYDEFFYFSMGATLSHQRVKEHGAPVCRIANTDALTSLLPYRLTGAQARAIEDIKRDMAKDIPMSRIVVGDVGCGKTVCAAAAMLIALQNGRQAVLMAPTEILARQHYADLAPLFEQLGYKSALLIGATTAAQKRKIKERLLSPDPQERIDLVIGTHALISDGVEFAAPGLVVTDEQHRFGARQRAKLSEKNTHAHLLVMSATPIPRSLALILYGDLDLSKIDEMPPGRQRVDTFCVDDSYRPRLHSFIQKQIEEGGQVYVVCPAVEEDTEEGDVMLSEIGELILRTSSEKPPLRAAVEHAKELQKIFPQYTVAHLHGKMKSAEKDEVMRAFASGEIKILVSTTVIEVGVNVPNANLMLVENAERFGLSQLHQLRGRVGRGSRKSYCILVAGGAGHLSATAKERLNTMKSTYDGYQIAEQDLILRGPGDFLANATDGSVRQSGGLSFRLANAAEDTAILTDATADAKDLLEKDPTLAAYPAIAYRVNAMFAIESGLIS